VGGTVAFDTSADFHFSASTDGLGNQQADFLSVAMHEVAHLLGFGASAAWNTYVAGGHFRGPASRAANGNQNVKLSTNGTHWESGTISDGREVAMDPSITTGTRKLFTSLDLAGLDDVGWDLVRSTATVSGSHTYATTAPIKSS